MSKPILAGYDPHLRDRAPVRFGHAIAQLTGAPLIVALVETGAPVTPISADSVLYAIAQTDRDLLDDCGDALAEIEAELPAGRVSVECMRLRSTSAARALHDAAERHGAALLVAGSSRRAPRGRVALGSTAERLINGSPCPVTLVPSGWDSKGAMHEIGVGYTDSDEAREALRAAHGLARRAGAALRVLTVVKSGLSVRLEADTYRAGQFGKSVEDVEGEHRLAAERHLREVVAELGDDVPVTVDAVVGDPADELVRLSQEVDLLVCGSRGYGPLRAVLLGSVTRRLAGESHCPLIVLARGVHASLEALVEEGATTPA